MSNNINLRADFLQNFHKFKNAFTLAETLITLAIIGVVAAMTLPAIINNIQDKQFKVAYKKDVNLITEAMKLFYANEDYYFKTDLNNEPKSICTLKKYLKISKIAFNCPRIETYQDDPEQLFDNWIVSDYSRLWHNTNKWFTKDKLPLDRVVTYDFSTIHLPNEAMIFFPCGNKIFIDVNGHKKPNVVGRDIFALPIKDGIPSTKIDSTFTPQGCFGETNTNTTLNKNNYVDDCLNGHGWGCSFLYLE